jgi:hypothetical protein
MAISRLGGVMVSVLAIGSKVTGFKPGRGVKNPQRVFFWRGSKSVGPLQDITACKKSLRSMKKDTFNAKLIISFAT